MRRSDAEKDWQGKLLDAWIPPSDAGEPIACLATSYTFDSVFFEEQCLARFARIRVGAEDETMAREYLIEREERLGQVKAVALVDRDHCRGRRCLRWDLLGARHGSRGGILHAKIVLLVWSNAMRLIVGSANLTETGYRRNRELYSVLDLPERRASCGQAFRDALNYLGIVVELCGAPELPAVARWREVLADAERRLDRLPAEAAAQGDSIGFVGLSPGRPSLFTLLRSAWEEQGGTCRSIEVISPFFDLDEKAARQVVDGLWSLGAQRGEVDMTVRFPAIFSEGGVPQVYAPSCFGGVPRPSCSAKVLGVESLQDGVARPLHAKAIRLSTEGDERCLTYIGSSNLTCAGTGLSLGTNWEAGIIVDSRDARTIRACESAFESIGGRAGEFVFSGAQPDPDEAEQGDEAPLPEFFLAATFEKAERDQRIGITLDGGPSDAPREWRILTIDGRLLIDRVAWERSGSRPRVILPWSEALVPSGFEVIWKDASGVDRKSWLPVCVARQADLPPPEELRDLPLEVLIEILEQARPISMIVASYLERRESGAGASEIELDPLRRFDSSSFLLQRMRRISLAFSLLARQLAKPCPTPESLAWRLEGPCGVKAVIAAIAKEFDEGEEYSFCLVELCLELTSIQLQSASGCLEPGTVRAGIGSAISSYIKEIESRALPYEGDMHTYLDKALAKIRESCI